MSNFCTLPWRLAKWTLGIYHFDFVGHLAPAEIALLLINLRQSRLGWHWMTSGRVAECASWQLCRFSSIGTESPAAAHRKCNRWRKSIWSKKKYVEILGIFIFHFLISDYNMTIIQRIQKHERIIDLIRSQSRKPP